MLWKIPETACISMLGQAYNCTHGSKEKLVKHVIASQHYHVRSIICECPGILEFVWTLCPDTSNKLSCMSSGVCLVFPNVSYFEQQRFGRQFLSHTAILASVHVLVL